MPFKFPIKEMIKLFINQLIDCGKNNKINRTKNITYVAFTLSSNISCAIKNVFFLPICVFQIKSTSFRTA